MVSNDRLLEIVPDDVPCPQRVSKRPVEGIGGADLLSADWSRGTRRMGGDGGAVTVSKGHPHPPHPTSWLHSIEEAFLMADEIMRQGVIGLADIVIKPGLINVDFADVRAIMTGPPLTPMSLCVGPLTPHASFALRQAPVRR